MTQPSETDSAETRTQRNIVRVPLDMIRPGSAQARTDFDAGTLDELAASIAESGVIQPVIVRGDITQGYELLAGERRWRAAQRAGLDVLPAIVRNDLSGQEAAVLGLIENLQRESLGIMDTARGLARLCEEHALTHEDVSRRIGKSRVYVTNFLRLCRLAEPVQTRLDAGELSLGHAKILAGLDPARQVALARKAATGGLSVRQLERAARTAPDTATPAAPATGNDMTELETRLSEHLGNAVQVRYDAERRRGELRIDFHDLDEFDGLLARLGFDA